MWRRCFPFGALCNVLGFKVFLVLSFFFLTHTDAEETEPFSHIISLLFPSFPPPQRPYGSESDHSILNSIVGYQKTKATSKPELDSFRSPSYGNRMSKSWTKNKHQSSSIFSWLRFVSRSYIFANVRTLIELSKPS